MKRIVFKTAAVTAAAMVFAIAPLNSTQVRAHHGYGGYHCGYGYYGGVATRQTQVVAPAAATNTAPPVQTVEAPKKNTNDFDPTIYDIQVVLFEKGYYKGDVDGLYGDDTKAALLKFQEQNGMEKTENADVKALKSNIELLEAFELYTLL